MELNDYLLSTLGQTSYPVTYSGEIPNTINRFLVKSVNRNEENQNSFEPRVNNGVCITLDASATDYSTEEIENNWRYYISAKTYNLYQSVFPHDSFSKESDKYLYYLNGIYSSEEKEVLVSIWGLNPIRVWINGRLVTTSTNSYNITSILFAFKLQKGINTLLCERMFFNSDYMKLGIVERENFISIKPLELFNTRENGEFFDEGLLEELKKSYAVIPEKTLFKDQYVKFVVLPKWFDTLNEEKINIEIRTAKGGLIKSFEARTGEALLAEIDESIQGVFVIKACGLENSKKSLDTYIFKGNFAKERNLLLKTAESIIGQDNEMVKCMKRLVTIPDVCNAAAELAQDELYQPMLKNYAEFENAMSNGDDIVNKGIFDIFDKTMMLFLENEIDDGYIAYRVYLPENYTKEKKYPLVLALEWGYAFSTLPRTARYIRRGEFDEAIIVTICARGELNFDFVNEIGYIKIIDKMLRSFNIDREKIYAVAACTAAVKLFGLAIRKPDLFTGLVNITAIPRIDDAEYLKNIESLAVYNMLIFDDYINIAMVYLNQEANLERVKNYFYNYYSHGECNSLNNSRPLLQALVKEKKEKYPRKLQLITQEPVFNKSYWLYIHKIEDLNYKAKIEAEIINMGEIKICTKNIKEFSMLLGLKEMNLNREIEIQVNGETRKVEIEGYSKITVKGEKSGFSFNVMTLKHEEFHKQYNSIAIKEELLGIKQVYLKKCVVLKSGDEEAKESNFKSNLFEILQCPLKEKLSNYKYELLNENNINLETLMQINFVIFISSSDKEGIKGKLLKSSGIEISVDGINYNNKKFSGDYFALIKTENPFNPEKHALIVSCNSQVLEEELIKFLNTFDYNPLFYSDAVIYNNGQYNSFRQE